MSIAATTIICKGLNRYGRMTATFSLCPYHPPPPTPPTPNQAGSGIIGSPRQYEPPTQYIVTIIFDGEKVISEVFPNDNSIKNYTLHSDDLNIHTIASDVKFVAGTFENPTIKWKH
jgi:hypothetical protein